VGYRLDRRTKLKKSGVGLMTILFTVETEAEMENVMRLVQNNEKPDFEFTRK
jgi:hypothetical protein